MATEYFETVSKNNVSTNENKIFDLIYKTKVTGNIENINTRWVKYNSEFDNQISKSKSNF